MNIPWLCYWGKPARFVVSSLVNVTLMYFLLKMNTVVTVWNSMPPVRRRISVRWCRFQRVRWIRVLGVPPDHKGLHRHHTCHYSDQIELKQIIKLLCFDNKYCKPGACLNSIWSRKQDGTIEGHVGKVLIGITCQRPAGGTLKSLTFWPSYILLSPKNIFSAEFSMYLEISFQNVPSVVNDVINVLPPYPPQKTSLSS